MFGPAPARDDVVSGAGSVSERVRSAGTRTECGTRAPEDDAHTNVSMAGQSLVGPACAAKVGAPPDPVG
jgi:hypothetical protein